MNIRRWIAPSILIGCAVAGLLITISLTLLADLI